MAEMKKCETCKSIKSEKWIEKKNLAGKVAYFCSQKCHDQYKQAGEENGICEFC